MKRTCVMLLFLVASGSPAAALEPEDGAVFVRVVDVGAGLCCVVKMPGDHYMIYDAGYWQGSGEQDAHIGPRRLLDQGRARRARGIRRIARRERCGGAVRDDRVRRVAERPQTR